MSDETYEDHLCPNCGEEVTIRVDGRILKEYEWCVDCKDGHHSDDWEVRWFNHRFRLWNKKDIATRDGYRCYICDKFLGLTSKEATYDHQVPLARGGLSTFDNLRYCCYDCNNRKGDLMLEEFLDEQD